MMIMEEPRKVVLHFEMKFCGVTIQIERLPSASVFTWWYLFAKILHHERWKC